MDKASLSWCERYRVIVTLRISECGEIIRLVILLFTVLQFLLRDGLKQVPVHGVEALQGRRRSQNIRTNQKKFINKAQIMKRRKMSNVE